MTAEQELDSRHLPAVVNCLTVRQPWAALIFRPVDAKDVENRTWPVPVRGPLLIHAGKGMTQAEHQAAVLWCRSIGAADPPPWGILGRGLLLGIVHVAAVWPPKRLPPSKRSRWHVEGQHGLYLEAQERLDVRVPLQGQQGLFKVLRKGLPAEVNRQLERWARARYGAP